MKKIDCERVESGKDLMNYLRCLSEDFKKNKDKEKWESLTVDQFLESAAAWLEGSKTYGKKASWKNFAKILRAGKEYE